MYKLGQKIKFLGRDAVILIDHDKEVLIQLSSNWIKWVDKLLISVNK